MMHVCMNDYVLCMFVCMGFEPAYFDHKISVLVLCVVANWYNTCTIICKFIEMKRIIIFCKVIWCH
jgi:hypothetical protein